MSYIDAAFLTSSHGASLLRRARRYSTISMRESTSITLHQEAWLRRLSNMDFTGQLDFCDDNDIRVD
jgi:hypothetical protein